MALGSYRRGMVMALDGTWSELPLPREYEVVAGRRSEPDGDDRAPGDDDSIVDSVDPPSTVAQRHEAAADLPTGHVRITPAGSRGTGR